MKYIEEEITLSELADRFLNLNDFKTPSIYDMNDLNIEIESFNLKENKREFKKIKNFIVKDSVDNFYTDGNLKGSSNHKIIENGNNISIKDHIEFKNISDPLDIVDIEVDENHNYFANGRLNHNTTSGGKAIGFHSSVRIRLASTGKLKSKDWGGQDQVIGNKIKATIQKNRIGPPARVVEFELYYDSGIDNYSGWLKKLKDYKCIKQAGAYYTYVLNEGTSSEEEVKFMSKDLIDLFNERPELRESMYNDLCKIMIIKYKDNSTTIRDSDDIEFDDSDDVYESENSDDDE